MRACVSIQMKSWLTIILWLAGSLCVDAQELNFSLGSDSTFNAAEDYAQTIDGFDVDVNQQNVINVGTQIAQDVIVASLNDDGVADGLSSKSLYRQRMDLIISSALPERTNIYSNVSFVNNNSSLNVVMTNLEVEHFFKGRCKIRVGRLANSVSESQFFGRIALEESSAHVFGRKLFINDALEFDGNLMHKGGPVYFIGLKPYFKPFNLKGAYAGLHQRFKKGWQLHAIVSVNRQFEADLQQYLPDHKGKRAYFSFEFETAHKSPFATTYLNVGANLNYVGLIPHAGGNFDFLKPLLPVVERRGDSFKETFTPSAGFRLHPSKVNPSLRLLSQVGLEAEVQGALADRFTALNICAYCRLNLTRRMVLTYYCTPQFVWQKFNPDYPSYIGGVVNYLRLSVTVGQPKRMFL